ncbi:MAG: NAD(P)-dependent oxidoreductase [Flavobacteriales bacterium]
MNILLLSPISLEAIEYLKINHTLEIQYDFGLDTLKDRSQTEIVITRSGPTLNQVFLEIMPQLRAVIRAGSGIDNIDIDFLKRKSIPLYQVTNFHANPVAELAVGLFIDLARKITHLDKSMRNGLWEKNKRLGMEINGKILGIVGMGKIGMRLAGLFQGWEINILGLVKNYSEDRKKKFADKGIELVESKYEIAEKADLIAITLPLNDETRLLIDFEFLRRMKKTVLIVNVGRGATIDENALFDYLSKNSFSAAALDVHMNEGSRSKFVGLDNVILTPHIGSSTKETEILIGKEIIRIINSIQLKGI